MASSPSPRSQANPNSYILLKPISSCPPPALPGPVPHLLARPGTLQQHQQSHCLHPVQQQSELSDHVTSWKIRSKHLRSPAPSTTSQDASYPSPKTPNPTLCSCSRLFLWLGTPHLFFLQLTHLFFKVHPPPTGSPP